MVQFATIYGMKEWRLVNTKFTNNPTAAVRALQNFDAKALAAVETIGSSAGTGGCHEVSIELTH